MDLFLDILTQFGLPVAAAAVMGLFIYIILNGEVESFLDPLEEENVDLEKDKNDRS